MHEEELVDPMFRLYVPRGHSSQKGLPETPENVCCGHGSQLSSEVPRL
jgi:hypothetical protein